MIENQLLCRDVQYSVNGCQVLKGVSFTLNAGDIMVVSGKNGSGKTTLLRVLAGVIECEEGTVASEGSVIYIAHKNAFKQDLSVYQNLLFWADFYDSREILQPTIHLLSLAHLLDIKYRQLSQGWQRRVSLCRLIISNADIWLLDEPYANLDEEGKDTIEGLVHSRAKQGGIVVITSHGNLKMENSKQLKL